MHSTVHAIVAHTSELAGGEGRRALLCELWELPVEKVNVRMSVSPAHENARMQSNPVEA